MSETELREALIDTLRAYHMAAFDYGHNHPIEECSLPMIVDRLALASIPAEPEQARWSVGGQSGMAPGVLDTLYAEPEQADAVAGLDEDLDWAWAIIANAGGGNWELERPEWRAAAEHWRDQVLPDLSARRAARLAPARDDGGAS